MNLDSFIDACESMKISEYDYDIGTELFNKDMNGKRHFTKKGAEKANREIEMERENAAYRAKQEDASEKARPILEKTWKRLDIESKAQRIMKGIFSKAKKDPRLKGLTPYIPDNLVYITGWDDPSYLNGGDKWDGNIYPEDIYPEIVNDPDCGVDVPYIHFSIYNFTSFETDLTDLGVMCVYDNFNSREIDDFIGTFYDARNARTNSITPSGNRVEDVYIWLIVEELKKKLPKECTIGIENNNDYDETYINIMLSNLTINLED